MSKFITVPNGDIKLTTTGSGDVILDTAGGSDVRVATGEGNFAVTGGVSLIETDRTFVKDNVLTLNHGETGVGLTTDSGTSGIEIDRGDLRNVRMVYDEDSGQFSFNSGTTLVGIETNGITSNADIDVDLVGVVRVSSDYLQNIDLAGNNPEIIPNIEWVNRQVQSAIDEVQETGFFQITRGEDNPSQVTVFSEDQLTEHSGSIEFTVDGDRVAVMGQSDFEFNFLRFTSFRDDYTENPLIESRIPGKDLILRATAGDQGNYGSVRVDQVFELTGQLTKEAVDNLAFPGFFIPEVDPTEDYVEDYGVAEAYVEDFAGPGISEDPEDYINRVNDRALNPNGVKIVGAPQGGGGTGLYFVNGVNTRDEFVSKQRALFMSMAF